MSTRRMLAAIAVVALVAGCGVPTERAAQVASPSEVPFGLLDEERRPVAGANPAGRVPVEVFLFSEDDERLVPVERRLDDASVAIVLAELDQGPSETEARRDLTSALADVDGIDAVEVDGGVAVVDLSPGFEDISGSDQRVALAQIVFTATARPGVGQVSFTDDGQPVEVPVGDGSLATGAVTRDDYADLAPVG